MLQVGETAPDFTVKNTRRQRVVPIGFTWQEGPFMVLSKSRYSWLND